MISRSDVGLQRTRACTHVEFSIPTYLGGLVDDVDSCLRLKDLVVDAESFLNSFVKGWDDEEFALQPLGQPPDGFVITVGEMDCSNASRSTDVDAILGDLFLDGSAGR
jgi:hypothetical protein